MESIFRLRLQKTMLRYTLLCLAGCLFSINSFPTARASEKTISNPVGMEFIRVNAGSFMMGSPETEPFRDADEILHKVTIKKPFYLQSAEVTVKQWRAVMGKKIFGRKRGEENAPVVRVSYYDCQNFIQKLRRLDNKKYRLPTEAEWEYACRAGTTTAYSWGNKITCSQAMYSNNTKRNSDCTLFYESMKLKLNQAAPVKSFAPNAWGFYDMHGNVWEWCSDEYMSYTDSSVRGKYHTMKKEARVRRGGSWFKYGTYLRSANRTYAHPGVKFQTTGFRLVLETD